MGAVLAPRLPRPSGIHALLQRGVSRRIKRRVCCVCSQRLPSEVPFYLLTCGINIIGSLVRSHQLMVYDVNNIPYCQKPETEAGRFLLEVPIGQYSVLLLICTSHQTSSTKSHLVYLVGVLKFIFFIYFVFFPTFEEL